MFKLLERILFNLVSIVSREKELVKEMANLKQAVQDVADSEVSMEDRVTAKVNDLKSISDDLQKQIDDLKAGNTGEDELEAALVGIKGRLDAFNG